MNKYRVEIKVKNKKPKVIKLEADSNGHLLDLIKTEIVVRGWADAPIVSLSISTE